MRTCFLVTPIGSSESATRARTDRFEQLILGPALHGLDMQVIRGDRISRSGLITNQIMELLVSAEMVVADMTDHNPNVFYEIGIRHATGLPIVHVKQMACVVPFDNANMRTLDYDFDAGNAAEAVQVLGDMIKSSLDFRAHNPFSAGSGSYLVLRDGLTAQQFRSLDVLDGRQAVVEHFRGMLSSAVDGALFWGQTVGGSAFPEDAEALMIAALQKGARFQFIISENPPVSDQIFSVLARLPSADRVRVVSAANSNLRFFGMGTSHLMISVRIDGRFNAIIVRDYEFIRFTLDWFERRFSALETIGAGEKI